MHSIDLRKYKRSESRIFTGRTEGQNARKEANLDMIDSNDEIVNIIIPNDTLSVNSSFFLGMFQKSLKDLGEDKFRKKYIFKCEREIIIKVNIEKNIKTCLLLLNLDAEEDEK